jgi:hypothetical protein
MIEIYWKSAMDNIVDTGFLKKTYTNKSFWSKEEEEILRAMYPQADAAEILNALPDRSWSSIMARAERKGIKRDRGRRPNSINVTASTLPVLSEQDSQFEAELKARGVVVSASVTIAQWSPALH